MTQPTPAQIEAAAEVIKRWSVMPMLIERARECARAALTAAAEVGEPPEPYVRQPGDPAFEGGAAWEAYQKAMEYCDNATIERCAQVVKDAADRHDSPLGCEPYAKAQLLEIYAAIRALKEEG